jgi:hypothetical protein
MENTFKTNGMHPMGEKYFDSRLDDLAHIPYRQGTIIYG